jgi:ABC-2 type transport system permease protein/sodium transport system permease protein
MSPLRRIRVIYTKELVELLRDHRTLIAMIIVPICLYPLLIVGSVHLLSAQDGVRKITRVSIAVPKRPEVPERDRPVQVALQLLQQARKLAEADASAHPDDTALRDKLTSIEAMDVKEVDVATVEELKSVVASGAFQLAMLVERMVDPVSDVVQLKVTIPYDRAEVRSESAFNRVQEMFGLLEAHIVDSNLQQLNIPRAVIEPIVLAGENVATPQKIGGMVLGSIVPLVLVLMTITGAIYPAIDLTAGERERGTLETLIVSPVPAMEVITGKYLVVTTVALLGAALNLLSMGATLYFGGFTALVGHHGDTVLPLGVLPIILLALVPFALLFSAVMVAVCSYARTFKEAQNYIMPVILAALIPGGIAALPGTELVGVNKVMPVMNMVLLARELLLGNHDAGTIALVVISTSLYAAAAVVVASHVYSTETLVFTDTFSLKSLLRRRMLRPSKYPGISLTLITMALMFPLWLFIQFGLQPNDRRTLFDTFADTARWMPACFVLLPVALLVYFKVNVRSALALHLPRLRYVAAALLLGATMWIPAHEMFVLQNRIWTAPEYVTQSNQQVQQAFAGHSLLVPLLLIAFVPAVCEELFFRGFVLTGLRPVMRKWSAVALVAAVFAIFHVMLVKFALTASLGLVLGLLCWQSRSVWPAILAHMLHNGSAVVLAFWPPYKAALGLSDAGELDHLPAHVIAIGILCVAVGVWLCMGRSASANTEQRPVPAA